LTRSGPKLSWEGVHYAVIQKDRYVEADAVRSKNYNVFGVCEKHAIERIAVLKRGGCPPPLSDGENASSCEACSGEDSWQEEVSEKRITLMAAAMTAAPAAPLPARAKAAPVQRAKKARGRSARESAPQQADWRLLDVVNWQGDGPERMRQIEDILLPSGLRVHFREMDPERFMEQYYCHHPMCAKEQWADRLCKSCRFFELISASSDGSVPVAAIAISHCYYGQRTSPNTSPSAKSADRQSVMVSVLVRRLVTVPSFRKKGAASFLCQRVCHPFQRSGHQAVLTTWYRDPIHYFDRCPELWIRSGKERWECDDVFEDGCVAKQAVTYYYVGCHLLGLLTGKDSVYFVTTKCSNCDYESPVQLTRCMHKSCRQATKGSFRRQKGHHVCWKLAEQIKSDLEVLDAWKASRAENRRSPDSHDSQACICCVPDEACVKCNATCDGESMLLCDGKNGTCHRAQHYLCAGLSELPAEKENWYCSDTECQAGMEKRGKERMKRRKKGGFLPQQKKARAGGGAGAEGVHLLATAAPQQEQEVFAVYDSDESDDEEVRIEDADVDDDDDDDDADEVMLRV